MLEAVWNLFNNKKYINVIVNEFKLAHDLFILQQNNLKLP